MAGHPQNDRKGLFIKDRINVGNNELTGNSTGVTLPGGLALSAQTDFITQASTYVKLPTGLTLSAQTSVITQDASNLLLPGGVRLTAQNNAILTGTSSGVQAAAGLALSAKTSYMTQNSTAVIFPGGVQISAKKYITANSTGFILTSVATKPDKDNGAAFTIISNSTGCCLAINSTGATWKYLLTTSVQPT